MYAADLDSIRYTFEASGSLWRDALVLKDRQTGSMWSQIWGEAIAGPRDGDVLELYPSEFITFAAIKEKYPQARVLVKDELGEAGSHYQKYFVDPDRIGIFGSTFESDDLPAKATALGLRQGREAIALPIDDLQSPVTAIVTLADSTAVVFYNPTTGEAVAYMASSESIGDISVSSGGVLNLDSLQLSSQDFLDGSPATASFSKYPLVTTFWFAWKSFFPNTRIERFH